MDPLQQARLLNIDYYLTQYVAKFQKRKQLLIHFIAKLNRINPTDEH